ncbi:MAG: polyphosphate:AMP phosphotransferase [Candidatus Accumulibacter phosphatis]|uniref:Polyphosphate:AMP phosphotransferase n=2 Tax=Candidatus Accumulibacter TaxID=327159 RepID=A0A080M8I9_9PROT|nr:MULTISPECIES: polyphosphate:AMP phosphotransferase [Candidatus Accumulibacter]KFB77543.1 MAG: polyphosphate:AMP phosphotransferase [Candidatus Accumulibacter cognatus]MBL8401970.1 polyphosphate:AMP phosphotransferase [Accumulibacter sp.]MBN8516444.1 polyphosphate:AMP phosphotransferase [Accumulibacter sp.]MBO3709613.1 polyphosphate:AMP phosphotransferase [Accumulibacter sp.]MCC2866541.1 polyphosphate:AMP phosphotransferase [Candidatus Accumulibacter phosphatis]
MFESAELGHKIDKETFKAEEPKLRAALLETQQLLRENGSFPVIILISGVDGSGKGETINVLYEWMDPRYLSTHAFYAPTAEERAHPSMWRYWRALPPKGRMGIFAGSWYSHPIAERISNDLSRSDFDQRMDQLNRFEAMLVNEGALVLKFWIHLSKDAQRERLKAIEANPLTRWRVTKTSWDRLKTYDKMQEVAGHLLRTTNTPWAPWIIVEGTDDRYRSLTVGKTILDSVQKRLADKRDQNSPVAPPFSPRIDRLDVLSSLDMTQSLTKKVYETELATWQGRLAELMRHPEFKKRALILAFEGSDAAGKGGAIRRVMSAMDARQYQIIPIAAPTEEERVQPYLWRFWRHMPRLGRVVIFDRTWYGRVLVERVERFCSEADWLRAYSEINDFEHDLWHAGGIVIKFWLQISDDEQLKRFDERAKVEHKRFKITEEDWRNREKAGAYHEAVCDMIDRTSSGTAPWTIVESNDKLFARIKVLRTICERLEKELKVEPMKEPRVLVAKAPKTEVTKEADAREVKEEHEHASKSEQAKQSKTRPAHASRAGKARSAKEAKAVVETEDKDRPAV